MTKLGRTILQAFTSEGPAVLDAAAIVKTIREPLRELGMLVEGENMELAIRHELSVMGPLVQACYLRDRRTHDLRLVGYCLTLRGIEALEKAERQE